MEGGWRPAPKALRIFESWLGELKSGQMGLEGLGLAWNGFGWGGNGWIGAKNVNFWEIWGFFVDFLALWIIKKRLAFFFGPRDPRRGIEK